MLVKLETEPFLPDTTRGGEKEEQLIKECLQVTSAQTFTYWICATISVTLSLSYVLIKKIRSSNPQEWQLAYGALTVINTTYSPNYEIIWVFEGISVVYMSVLFISSDLLLAAVLAHISYQFKVLQNQIVYILTAGRNEIIKHSREDQTNSSKSQIGNSSIPYDYLNKNLTNIVRYHLAIIGVAEEMEDIFSNLFLITFLGTLILLCFTVYQTSTVGINIKLIRYLGETAAATLQVFLVCFWGDQVASESEKVGMAVFHSDFVGTDLRYQKSLSFIIRRSRNPIKVTAGKFSDVRITNFAWIVRTSYSALMVLFQAENPET